ncbi:MAG TPA: aminoacyl--tRNA ligase-related protein [Candidatus Paceibacterota bacterium]
MRQSQLFTKTRREAPKDEVSKNAQLLIRAGYVQKTLAGVYSFLPLGLRTLEKVKTIIREEMNSAGGQEVSLASLQDKSVWEKTDRWDSAKVDNWFKTELANGTEVGLGFTHEEPLTELMKDHIQSFRDLPRYAYQFQTKFRNEKRAKSGIMRGREFLMKDLYSFSKDDTEHAEFYEKMKVAYKNVFDRAGVGHLTYITFAAGGSFSKFSHEFQMVTDAGEDIIYIDEDKGIAINEEVNNPEVHEMLGLNPNRFRSAKAVEVGNIFNLGTRFSDALDLSFMDESGEKKKVVMGSYGIGVPRLMGAIVEALSDEKGIVWPKSVAPFALHLVLVNGSEETKARAEALYEKLTALGAEVLFDDRDARPGEKFGDADLMGMPLRAVISDKNQQGESGDFLIEVKDRKTGEVRNITEEELVMELTTK